MFMVGGEMSGERLKGMRWPSPSAGCSAEFLSVILKSVSVSSVLLFSALLPLTSSFFSFVCSFCSAIACALLSSPSSSSSSSSSSSLCCSGVSVAVFFSFSVCSDSALSSLFGCFFSSSSSSSSSSSFFSFFSFPFIFSSFLFVAKSTIFFLSFSSTMPSIPSFFFFFC